MDKAIPDGPRFVSMADLQVRTGPGAVVEAVGLISAALKIKPRLAVDRERIRWRLQRAVMLLDDMIEIEPAGK